MQHHTPEEPAMHEVYTVTAQRLTTGQSIRYELTDSMQALLVARALVEQSKQQGKPVIVTLTRDQQVLATYQTEVRHGLPG